MDDILKIVLFVDKSTLNIHDIIQLSAVNKACLSIAHDTIKFHQDEYKKKRSHIYNKNIHHFHDTCTMTEAKTLYKLNVFDLSHLDFKQSPHPHFKNKTMTKYSMDDVIGLSIIKHGSLEFMDAKHVNESLAKREMQFEKLITKYKLSNYKHDIMRHNIYIEFMRNGGKGVRIFEQNISCFSEAKEFVKKASSYSIPHIDFNTFFTDYLIDKEKTENTIQGQIDRCANFNKFYDFLKIDICIPHYIREEYIKTGNKGSVMAWIESATRKHNLETELRKHNMNIRKDSITSAEYIANTNNSCNLPECVRIMREMDFFHTKTNYAKIMKQMLDLEYDNAKENIREIYGYVRDHEEYMDILSEYVDKVKVSKDAKVEALKNYNGDVPDFVQVK